MPACTSGAGGDGAERLSSTDGRFEPSCRIAGLGLLVCGRPVLAHPKDPPLSPRASPRC